MKTLIVRINVEDEANGVVGQVAGLLGEFDIDSIAFEKPEKVNLHPTYRGKDDTGTIGRNAISDQVAQASRQI